MENPKEVLYKTHRIRGAALRENSSYRAKWKPSEPVIDGNSYTFDMLNFANRLWKTEAEAVQHSIEYAKWIIDSPTTMDDDDDDDDEQHHEDTAERLI